MRTHLCFAMAAGLCLGCEGTCGTGGPGLALPVDLTEPPPAGDSPVGAAAVDDAYAAQREALVQLLRDEGIASERVLAALGRVKRHLMVPDEVRALAYADRPLSIGHDQTISQPYVVALMTELAGIEPGDRVLEVGTGSGYQAALLAELGAEVFSIEIVEPLALQARRTLDALGYADRIRTRVGDGYAGWPAHAPFDAILITAAPPAVPEPLTRQLAVGGRLVAPVGKGYQHLVVVTRTDTGLETTASIPVRFVPMTGEAQRER